jgi:hypothetical protein
MRNVSFICHKKSIFLFFEREKQGSILRLFVSPLAVNKLAID